MVLSMNANANAMDDDEADDLVADADEELLMLPFP